MAEAASYLPQRRWSRLILSLVIGSVVAFLDYKSRNFGQAFSLEKLAEALSRGLFTAVLGAVLMEMWSLRDYVDGLKGGVLALRSGVEALTEAVVGDERIIFARQRFGKAARTVSIVGIEPVEPVPGILKDLPQCGEKKWEHSISVLRFDRIQDLLFSTDYLNHFFSLRQKARNVSRVLVINDIPRSTEAIHSFLHISEKLGIKTFVYRKSEYYGMLSAVDGLLSEKAFAASVGNILRGNLELNVMVRDDREFREWNRGKVERSMDYILRYASGNTNAREIVIRGPAKLSVGAPAGLGREVRVVLVIVSAALKEQRLGERAFSYLCAENGSIPENHWSNTSLGTMLKERGLTV